MRPKDGFDSPYGLWSGAVSKERSKEPPFMLAARSNCMSASTSTGSVAIRMFERSKADTLLYPMHPKYADNLLFRRPVVYEFANAHYLTRYRPSFAVRVNDSME